MRLCARIFRALWEYVINFFHGKEELPVSDLVKSLWVFCVKPWSAERRSLISVFADFILKMPCQAIAWGSCALVHVASRINCQITCRTFAVIAWVSWRRRVFFFFWARRAFRKVRNVIVRSRWWTKWVSFFGGLNNWKHGNWHVRYRAVYIPHDLSCAPSNRRLYQGAWTKRSFPLRTESNAASLHRGCPSWSKQVAFAFTRSPALSFDIVTCPTSWSHNSKTLNGAWPSYHVALHCYRDFVPLSYKVSNP